MKSIVIAALLASTQARPHDYSRIMTESYAESQIRSQIQTLLRSYLFRGDAYPETILPGSVPILPIPSEKIEL
jgi:hypothetical protein